MVVGVTGASWVVRVGVVHSVQHVSTSGTGDVQFQICAAGDVQFLICAAGGERLLAALAVVFALSK